MNNHDAYCGTVKTVDFCDGWYSKQMTVIYLLVGIYRNAFVIFKDSDTYFEKLTPEENFCLKINVAVFCTHVSFLLIMFGKCQA